MRTLYGWYCTVDPRLSELDGTELSLDTRIHGTRVQGRALIGNRFTVQIIQAPYNQGPDTRGSTVHTYVCDLR